jgi:hypothetical protein
MSDEERLKLLRDLKVDDQKASFQVQSTLYSFVLLLLFLLLLIYVIPGFRAAGGFSQSMSNIRQKVNFMIRNYEI